MKKFFRKIGAWFKRHKPTKRRLIQVYAALLYNANIKGFVSGNIYQGATKSFCLPGLNCYSCPGAVGACPLGALQNALSASGTRAPFYVFGIIILLGLILGRTVCGFLCPVGLGQELLYKIRTPKLKKSRVTYVLSYLKYVFLAVLVVAVPLMFSFGAGAAVPAFCKYVCPAGTFGGAIGLLVNPSNASFFEMLGSLFTWKFAVLVVVMVASVFIFRVFCRFVCPLGAIYGFFCRIALLGIKLDKNKCTDCGLCLNVCKMDIRRVGDHECIQCGACISACPAKAISWKGSKLFVHPNAEAVPEKEVKPLASFLTPQPAEASAEAPINAPLLSSAEGALSAPEGEALGVPDYETQVRRVKRRNFWLQFAAWAVALCVYAGALVYYNFIDKDITVGNQVGNECPDFTLPLYGEEGGTFTLSETRGKITVVNFWATWCESCVAEIPYFEELQQAYPDEVTVVAIQGIADVPDVEAFIVAQGWGDYSILFAQDTIDGTTCETYTALGGKNAWPMTLILDSEGIIRYSTNASMTFTKLNNYVANLL